MEKECDVAVIGAGPAGLAAATEADKAGCKVMMIDRDDGLGGILQQCIHPGFGLIEFKEEMAGPEYAQRYIDMLPNTNIEVVKGTMVLDMTSDKEIYAINEQGIVKIVAKSIVLAMGCRERTRGAIKIPGYRPTGVYTAGTAQRFVNIEGFMPGTKFVILGSGDIGMIMARRLTWEGAKVQAVVEILPFPSGLVRNKVQCLDDYGIPLYLSHTVVRVHGRDRVTGITIAKVDDAWKPIPGSEIFFDCDTLLLSVGLIPENEVSKKAGVKLGKTNGPEVNQFLQTNIDGIFAAGNVLQVHDLVDNVSAEARKAGRMAAMSAAGTKIPNLNDGDSVPLVAGNGIGYVLPTKINMAIPDEFVGESGLVKLSLRVKKPVNDQYLKVKNGETEIYKKAFKYMRPSEMILFELKPEVLSGIDASQSLEVFLEPKEVETTEETTEEVTEESAESTEGGE
ncbi:MAG TPA: FAD-dependent oxidoreductase [Candidatus Lokiarchaeia archaeon]|nr:FAD-dependent oxidoreductase [Candidatus Lokiarchaeia archaeon]